MYSTFVPYCTVHVSYTLETTLGDSPQDDHKGDRRQWGEGGGVIALLHQQRLQTQTVSQAEMTMPSKEPEPRPPKPKGQAWDVPLGRADDVVKPDPVEGLSQTHVVEKRDETTTPEVAAQPTAQPVTPPPEQLTTTPPTQTTTTTTTQTTSLTTSHKDDGPVVDSRNETSSKVAEGVVSETMVISKSPIQQEVNTEPQSSSEQVSKSSPGKPVTSESPQGPQEIPTSSGPKSVSVRQVLSELQCEDSKKETTENESGDRETGSGTKEPDRETTPHVVEEDIEILEYEAMLEDEDNSEQEVEEEEVREQEVTPVES